MATHWSGRPGPFPLIKTISKVLQIQKWAQFLNLMHEPIALGVTHSIASSPLLSFSVILVNVDVSEHKNHDIDFRKSSIMNKAASITSLILTDSAF